MDSEAALLTPLAMVGSSSAALIGLALLALALWRDR